LKLRWLSYVSVTSADEKSLAGAKTYKILAPLEYTMLINGDKPNGGMLAITPEMGNIPPNWVVYFAVDDCDAKVKKATELGGTVMKPAEDIPGVGRFAILTDPQGAVFAIIKTNPQDQPG
jgi:predicted enzyme related to lactoylglutathione lyase